MCGIIGYKGKDVSKILLNGLKKLEYRGYDSAGIALKNKDEIQIIKSKGNISKLEEKIENTKLIKADLGIAHTRWATHGKPSEINAHPHTAGKITLVHNGIIENASTLKKELIDKGINFYSDTDTEVIAALINYYYNGNMLDAIEMATKKLVGSYALGIIDEDDENLYALRKDSPLIIGFSKDKKFITSDINAITDYIDKYILLDEGDIAIINDDIKIYNNDKLVNKKIYDVDFKSASNDKKGYKHYMLKEIMEEPILLKKFFGKNKNLKDIPDISGYEEVHIVACGSAMYAGIIGKNLIEDLGIKCNCYIASEYRYENIIYDRKTLVILISQSGETADTIAALRKAKSKNIDTLGIVNVTSSTIVRESDKHIFINAGPEIAVATTKAYMLQVASLIMLYYKASNKVNDDIDKIPSMVDEIIHKDIYKNIAKEIYKNEDIYFIGRLMDYAMCLEGSLKLKEVSYIHSEAYAAGELKHGTISLIEEGTPVFAIITLDNIRDKTISNTQEVMARGAKPIIITNEKTGLDVETISVPKVAKELTPLLVVPILQLISYETALLRGCEIDKPKNLAKSVTVE